MRVNWSEPGLLSFVLSPKGSRTGPDFPCKPRETALAPVCCFRLIHSGDGNRTRDLKLMRLSSYRCSTPHEQILPQQGVRKSPVRDAQPADRKESPIPSQVYSTGNRPFSYTEAA